VEGTLLLWRAKPRSGLGWRLSCYVVITVAVRVVPPATPSIRHGHRSRRGATFVTRRAVQSYTWRWYVALASLLLGSQSALASPFLHFSQLHYFVITSSRSALRPTRQKGEPLIVVRSFSLRRIEGTYEQRDHRLASPLHHPYPQPHPLPRSCLIPINISTLDRPQQKGSCQMYHVGAPDSEVYMLRPSKMYRVTR
jgi:hypothetical protein